MRPLVLTVGPLVASSATKIAASQSPTASAQHLVLNAATVTDAAATAVCASQTPAGAGALTINGTQASGGIAYFGTPRRVYITCAANESGNTFTITGLTFGPGPNLGPDGVSETVTGSNGSLVSTKAQFQQVTAVSISGAASGAVTVGMAGVATLDVARQVLITSGGSDTGITFTISGTDWAGYPISEVLTGGATTATSLLSYLTVTDILTSGATASTITVGTNGVASSNWVNLDPAWELGPTSIQINGSGTVNWTIQQSLDNDDSATSMLSASAVTWVNHPDPNLVASAVTTGVQGNYAYAPKWVRLVLNSGTGSAKARIFQSSTR